MLCRHDGLNMMWHLQKKNFLLVWEITQIGATYQSKKTGNAERIMDKQTRGRGSHTISSILRIRSWFCQGFCGCARGLTDAADEAAPQLLLHPLSKKEHEVYKCAIIYNYQVTWSNTPLWFRGLQDESEACFSMINEGATVFLPKALQMLFLPQLRSPLLHLQSHQGEITTCLCCHLFFSKNP